MTDVHGGEPAGAGRAGITGNDEDNYALSLISVNGLCTTARRIALAKTKGTSRQHEYLMSVPGTVRDLEIDNRADTTVLGANMTFISFTGHSCDVQAFMESMPTQTDVPIATAATAYDDPDTGAETTILKFNQPGTMVWDKDEPQSW